MLDTKTQSQLLEATSAVLRAYLVAMTQSWAASASGGVALWTAMLGAAAPRGGASAMWPARQQPPDAMTTSTIGAGFFSSYRSDGGHAVAQIVAPASQMLSA
jgi:hypothetical protein